MSLEIQNRCCNCQKTLFDKPKDFYCVEYGFQPCEQFNCDEFRVRDDNQKEQLNNENIKDTIKEYLRVVQVLFNSKDMEEIIGERDKHYGESDKVQQCIEYIDKIL